MYTVLTSWVILCQERLEELTQLHPTYFEPCDWQPGRSAAAMWASTCLTFPGRCRMHPAISLLPIDARKMRMTFTFQQLRKTTTQVTLHPNTGSMEATKHEHVKMYRLIISRKKFKGLCGCVAGDAEPKLCNSYTFSIIFKTIFKYYIESL